MEEQTKDTGAYKSPDKTHGFNFVWAGEIRFGPSYYIITLDGEIVPGKLFGFEFKWHPESTFLALQEWLTTEYRKGPVTALTLVDLQHRKFARISTAEKGFIKPIKFENDLIIFEKEYLSSGKTTEYEININEIKNWE